MRSATIPTLPLGLTLGMAAVASLMFAAQQARADILNVTANVAATCSVQAGSLDFGTYSATTDTDATGSFTATCSIDADLLIALNGGANYTGIRNIVNGGESTIPYQLFQNSGRTTEWGDEGLVPAGKRLVSIQGGDVARNVDVWGRLVASGSRPAGTYSDVVNITFSIQ